MRKKQYFCGLKNKTITNNLFINKLIMKMNLLRISMVAMCAILMSGLMTGCNKDNNEPDDPQNPEKGPAIAARANAKAVISSDILKYYDVTIDYYNNDGELKQMKLETEELILETKAALPTKSGMRMTMKEKEGIDFENMDETIQLKYSFSYKSAAVDANDFIIGEKHELLEGGTEANLQGKKAYVWVKAFNEKLPVSFLFEFDKDGNSKSLEW